MRSGGPLSDVPFLSPGRVPHQALTFLVVLLFVGGIAGTTFAGASTRSVDFPAEAPAFAARFAAQATSTTFTVNSTDDVDEGALELSADADLLINGIDPSDLSGRSLAVGDVNNDGVADLVVGAYQGDPGGRTDAGETYVLFGPLEAGTLELATDADITINGIDPGDKSGTHVALGDINNDETLDLIIGAFSADPGGRDAAGETRPAGA